MIGKGHPETKENLKELRKRGDDLFFSTTANMLFALEESGWTALGHVIPTDMPRANQPIPQLKGKIGNGVRLIGAGD